MKKIITYGTFDLFHVGHFNILKRAREQGDYLIVGVTSESYDIERGKLNVHDDLLTRIRNVEATGFADKIILEEYQGQKINDVIKYKIDTLVIGSDWAGKFDYLKEYCKVLYLDRTKDISSTQLRANGTSILRIGIVTDNTSDNNLTNETLYVSGLHVAGVYSSDLETAQTCKDRFELAFATNDFNLFLDKVDIVYVKTSIETRTRYSELSLKAGKHVIVEPPLSLSETEVMRLRSKAYNNKVLLIERVTIAYLRAFTQLVWYLHGGLIGEILAIKSVLNITGKETGFQEAQLSSAFAIRKLLTKESEPLVKNAFLRRAKDSMYFMGVLEQQNTVASFEVVDNMEMKSELSLFGTRGCLSVPGDWMNIGYFQVNLKEPGSTPQHYSFNSEGNGFRYLLLELLLMISDDRSESIRYSDADSLACIKLLCELNTRVDA